MTLRDIPSVQRVLSEDRVQRLVELYSHDAVVDLVRSVLDAARQAVRAGDEAPAADQVAASVEDRAAESWRAWPNHVVNATGVILHTNLGRAPLSKESLAAVERAGRGYGDLELDLDTGRRGSRQARVSALVCQITGAEAAMVVNNNASALLLGLAAVAAGKEVIVSRGEAIEIGGGFRIPDVLRQSGAELVEVGTTNRTYVRDFEAAITDRTGAILSAHASNFKIAGFTAAPELSSSWRWEAIAASRCCTTWAAAVCWTRHGSGWPTSRCRRRAWQPACHWRSFRATSCSAGRRPESSRATRSWSPWYPNTRWLARSASTS